MLTLPVHKRLKRQITAALVVALLCGCFVASAPGLSYREFTDVSEESWYFPYVTQINEAGLVPNGFSKSFDPEAATTTAEFAYVLFRAQGKWVRSANAGEDWSGPYLEELSNVVGHDIPLEPITRYSAASILSKALSLEVPGADVPSPFTDTKDVSAIAVFKAGLMSGIMDHGERVFSGDAVLTHAHLAATGVQLLRHLKTEQTEKESPVYKDLPYTGVCIPPDTALPDCPVTEQEFRQVFEYMMINDLDTVELKYQGIPRNNMEETIEVLKTTYRQFRYERSEYFSYFDHVEIRPVFKTDGTCLLHFTIIAPQHDLELAKAHRHDAFVRAHEVITELYTSGTLSSGMTERERARVITDWVSRHTEYKNTESRDDHTAWSVLCKGTGVCDGYASALQLLLSLDNIQCWGQYGSVKVNGEAHQWTAAILDGELVGIDATLYRNNTTYFGMSPELVQSRYNVESGAFSK